MEQTDNCHHTSPNQAFCRECVTENSFPYFSTKTYMLLVLKTTVSMIYRLAAEDFTARVFMKSVGDRSATCRPSPTSTCRKPLLLSLQSKSVVASLLWLKRLAVTGFVQRPNRRPFCDLCKTLPLPLDPLCDCQFFSRGKVATLWDRALRELSQ